ncbi:hypothetical protein BEWA_022960 [Theileria equi strain WA]|uniref:Uncharacterized protein n=1 Tax=Theileria equi strain WA TaxID=1537102 RepID=L0AW46_THEEQ|nr:hypothetical protein BEWA_022960 [Theileria equi strain WA]AFZ79448.1 hypothetical protein BEWA_022960 [Theileria equi strain WA]|eukprot:XP_004829114.1 hypothetical protein BEWA_022960 [Theileria equi strain WA]
MEDCKILSEDEPIPPAEPYTDVPIEPVPAEPTYLVNPKNLHTEEVLRKLQTLTSGDSVFFKKSALGDQMSSFETPTYTDFVHGTVVCWTFDELKQYIVINVRPHGNLQFLYSDLFDMTLARDVFLHKLDIKVDIVKASAEKSIDTPYNVDSAVSCDVRVRPVPPGVETFCKCRFINKLEFVRKLRGIIRSNKHMFMEKTMYMKELRLIMSQNVRAYELEMVAYVLNANPWQYSSNPSEEPSQERVKEILELYKNAVRNPIYIALYNKWKEYIKSIAE